MPWRQFTLLCVLIISAIIYSLEPLKTGSYEYFVEVDDPIMTTDGISYAVAELPLSVNEEGLAVVTRSKKLCGRYFFTVRFDGETHIGFHLSLPDESGVPTLSYTMVSPRKSYRLVSPSYLGQLSPSVEFSNGNIIVHINPSDLAKATCLNDRIFV